MALIKCPECELTVSDKAINCPHCGYPMIEYAKPIVRKSTRRKRLPNGFGQITELKTRNLRKPFRAMVTVGYNENGRPIAKLLKPVAYFKTYNEAYEALIKYNKDPFDLDEYVTLQQVYDKWYPTYEETHRPKSAEQVKYLWKHFGSLYDVPIREIKPINIIDIIDNSGLVREGRHRIKSIISMVLDYALQREWVDKNVAKSIKINTTKDDIVVSKEQIHTDFTSEEICLLESNSNNNYVVGMIYIQCYMGWRPTELCEIKTSNVNIAESYIIGGGKTKSGTDRKVPIHSKIKELVKKYYKIAVENNQETLFVVQDGFYKNCKYEYSIWTRAYAKHLKNIGIIEKHLPHDPRVHFTTMCKESNINEYAIKRMLGHHINDITEEIYTKRKFDWFIEEIEKI